MYRYHGGRAEGVRFARNYGEEPSTVVIDTLGI